MKNYKIKILKPCGINGKHYDIDKTAIVSQYDAETLVAIGKAEILEETKDKITESSQTLVKIKILSETIANNEVAKIDDIIELNSLDAQTLINLGKAELVKFTSIKFLKKAKVGETEFKKDDIIEIGENLDLATAEQLIKDKFAIAL